MIIEERIIRKGTKLYRFINTVPSKCKLGLVSNIGNNGRCNKHHNIYYCSLSQDALFTELGSELNGTLIVSEVIEDIYCGCVVDAQTHKRLRGRVADEEKTMVHEMILEPNNYDIKTTYEETSEIADKILEKYPEGLVYSSVNSPDIIIGKFRFYVANEWSDFGPFENVALTELGFKKIKQRPPIVYWHK